VSTWTCRRQSGGVKCGHVNPGRKRKCESCGKTRPARKQPAHRAALSLSYERYVELNGGEFCGICGREPKPGKKLRRDHEHKGNGKPRGLLCWTCNLVLRNWVTVEWLRSAIRYLERSA
jgi:hypothetical protein